MLPVAQDVFNPVLIRPSTVAVNVSEEQIDYIQRILDSTSSDSASAKRAFKAIMVVLTTNAVKPPVIGSLSPSTAAFGDAPIELHVMGSLFTAASQIVWEGSMVPTTYISASELSATVNIPATGPPRDLPVRVVTELNVLSEADRKSTRLNSSHLGISYAVFC